MLNFEHILRDRNYANVSMHASMIDINVGFGVSKYDDIDLSSERLKSEVEKYSIKKGILHSYECDNNKTKNNCRKDDRFIYAHSVNLDKPDLTNVQECSLIVVKYKQINSNLLKIARFAEKTKVPMLISVEANGTAREIAETLRGIDVDVIMSDVNYNQVEEAIQILSENKNYYIDTTRLCYPYLIERIDKDIGVDRIVYGSGAPFREIAASLNYILRSRITASKKKLILGGNAIKLFRLNMMDETDTAKLLKLTSYKGEIIDMHGHPDFRIGSEEGAKSIRSFMDSNVIGISVMSSLNAITRSMREGNKEVHAIINKNKGMYGYVVVDPNDVPGSCKEMDKHFKNPKFVGCKVHCHYSKTNVGDDRLTKLLVEISKRGKPVLLHPSGGDWMVKLRKIAQDNPILNIIVAHGAWHGIENHLSGLKNVYFDFSNSHPEKGVIENLRGEIDHSQFLFGSDMNIIDPAFIIGLYIGVGFTEKEIDDVMHGNVRRIFDFDKK